MAGLIIHFGAEIVQTTKAVMMILIMIMMSF
jgi:hypothetical protein